MRITSAVQTASCLFRELTVGDAAYLSRRIAARLTKALPEIATQKFGQVRKSWIRAWYPFDKHDLLVCLYRLGLRQGDTALVHCSYEKFEGFNGKPSDVVDVLLEAVGPEGNVLMPTMPFTGSALDYVARGVMLDVRRTVSLMGLISEVFRRTKGIQRSVHPTHPVAICGPKASELIADHHLATTPCGRHSPFAKLLDLDGKIVFLGTDLTTNTFFHTVDEIIETDLPVQVFTQERYSLQCKDAEGKIVTCNTRLFAKPSPRRCRGKIIRTLKQQGVWRGGRAGCLTVVVLHAKDVLAVSHELARRNEFLVGIDLHHHGRAA